MGKGTIFYVHGAGNRGPQAEAYESALRKGFGLAAGSTALRRSAWGDEVGPDQRLPNLDKTLPLVASVIAGLAPETVTSIDPLAPLKALAPAAEAGAEPAAGGIAPEAEAGAGAVAGLAPELAAFAPEPGAAEAPGFAPGSADADRLLGILASGLIDLSEVAISPDNLQAAARAVATNPAYAAATGTEEEIFDATLRSVVGVAIERDGVAGFGIGDITGAVGSAAGAVAQALLGSGVLSFAGSWLGTTLGPPAKLSLSKHVAQQRSKIMHEQVLFAADVLAYQRHGARVREWIRGELDQLEPPIVALGHSLGGIILVDTLFEPKAKKTGVEQLVTFGSQSAFLNAIEALGEVRPNISWTNIWTSFDFASFRAGEIWAGLVDDVEIPIEIGFPDAHGAYYETPAFYQKIRALPVARGILS